MDVSFTTHPKGGPDKFYMAVAEKAEWEEVLGDLDEMSASPATLKLIEGLKGWGI